MIGVEMIRVEWRQIGHARMELGRLDHVPKWRAGSQTHRSVVHPMFDSNVVGFVLG